MNLKNSTNVSATPRPATVSRRAARAAAVVTVLTLLATWARAQSLPAADNATKPAASAPATLHPALFLVGDSIMKTGTPPGDRGPWGMGYEIIPLFDATKIHVYNEGAGGRSSRGYIQEGLWGKILQRIEPGDTVLLMFGHNDAANSANYPDRTTLKGSGDETQEIDSPVDGKKETIHTYGFYLKQYVTEAKAKGATVIILSPVTRNTWVDGKIKRGFDGYVQWAADAAKASGASYIDLNKLAADRYDALGQQETARYFADTQHTTKLGAQLHAGAVIEGLRQLKDLPVTKAIAPTATPSPATARATRPAP